MDLRRLHHVLLLAEELNFARAAERAHLSQSAFSRSIQTLETEIGLKLFDRGPRFVRPTSVGERMIERARRLLAGASDLVRELGQLKTSALGDVAVGVGPHVATSILPPVLSALHKQHPSIRVHVEISNWEILLQHLLAERVDFFLSDVRDLTESVDIEIHRVARHPGSLFCRPGHPLMKMNNPRLDDLRRYKFATVRQPEEVKRALRPMFGLRPGSELPVALECDNLVLLRDVAMHTDIVLSATHSAIRQELASGVLKEIHIAELMAVPPLHSEWGIVQLVGRTLSPAGDLLLGMLAKAAEADAAASVQFNRRP